LHYYTGMMFEIADATGLQLCGGGRYDELVSALGGRQPMPAVGFAYGLERVVLATPEPPPSTSPTGVAVIWEGADTYSYAVQVAQQLRQHGISTVCDTRERSFAQQLRDSERRGLQVVVVTSADMATQTVQWRSQRVNERMTLPEWLHRYGGQA
jgi:histidyl-tRNA synthetase